MAELGFLPSEAGAPTGAGKILAQVPDSFRSPGLASVIGRSQGKFRAVSPGQRRAVCPELEPGMYETIFGDFPENYSRVTKWNPRGAHKAPQAKATPITLIDERVPDGSRLWLEQYFFYLAPSSRELNYYWQILINGIDVINYGSATQFPGRPSPANVPVSFGQTRDQQPCIGPGSHIEVVVMALSDLMNTDDISATITGSLEGVRP